MQLIFYIKTKKLIKNGVFTMDYVLQTENLCKSYGRHPVLKGLNINVPKGAIYGLVGKNGAGKTTLMRIICGLQRQDVGNLFIFNTNSSRREINQARRKIGAIVETPALHLNMSAEENLKLQMTLLNNYNKDKAQQLLEFVGLSETGRKEARNFSLGMRQRLAIALALCGDPELLILDEPTNGLDPEGIIEVRELLLRINKERNITIVISSHLLDELSRIATYYGFVKDGVIVKEVSAEELNADPDRQTVFYLNHTNGLIIAMEKFKNKYELLDDKTLLVHGPIDISPIVLSLFMQKILVNRVIEKSESLEDRFFDLLGGKEND